MKRNYNFLENTKSERILSQLSCKDGVKCFDDIGFDDVVLVSDADFKDQNAFDMQITHIELKAQLLNANLCVFPFPSNQSHYSSNKFLFVFRQKNIVNEIETT